MVVRTSRTRVTNAAFVSGVRSANWKKAPWCDPRRRMYRKTSITGHVSDPVRPTKISIPFPSWSHFDRLRWTRTTDGASKSLIATSPHARWTRTSKADADGTVISPDRKKPKKQSVAAALSITRSCDSVPVVTDHTCSIPLSIAGVIGRRCLVGLTGRRDRSRATPDCKSFRRGMRAAWVGSGSPLII